MTSLDIEFEDNRVLPTLFSTESTVSDNIKTSFGVTLTLCGNRLNIDSHDPENALHAQQALLSLYESARRGEEISEHTICAAIAARQASARRAIDGAHNGTEPTSSRKSEVIIPLRNRPVRALGDSQLRYVEAMTHNTIVFADGPAGTGKTFLAVCWGLYMLQSGMARKIILARPAIEAGGEKIGFLPGDMREKLDPYFRPIYDILHARIGKAKTDRFIDEDVIEVAPLAFMRGRTLEDCFVLLDEAQNATPSQIKMFLTRLGDGAKMVIAGDPEQTDLNEINGLAVALERLRGIDGIEAVHFGAADVIRHRLIARILQHWSAADSA